MTARILLATDGHAPSEAAVVFLEALGDRATWVEVVCVATFDLALEAAEDAGHYSPDGARAAAKRIAEATAERLRGSGFEAGARVETGPPADRVVDVLEAGAYDLALLGGGRQTWLGQRLLGSVSTGVMHASPSPVIVVREADRTPPMRVLVGADGSDDLGRALGAFVGFADPERCSLLVLSVAADDDEPGRRTASGYTGSATERLRERGFACEERVASGDVTRTLLQEAEDGRHDLIVVGSRGRVVARRGPLGSVSDRIVRHARATLLGR